MGVGLLGCPSATISIPPTIRPVTKTAMQLADRSTIRSFMARGFSRHGTSRRTISLDISVLKSNPNEFLSVKATEMKRRIAQANFMSPLHKDCSRPYFDEILSPLGNNEREEWLESDRSHPVSAWLAVVRPAWPAVRSAPCSSTRREMPGPAASGRAPPPAPSARSILWRLANR
jgi:hypothetical protein